MIAGRGIRRFTLIELVISLAVFSLLMVLLLRFLTTTERAWALSDSAQQMLDNQRIVLELMERDLNTAIASSLPGREIGFYIADPEDPATQGISFVFVAASNMNENADYRLCEIAYRVVGTSLQRQLISAADVDDWDFYANTDTDKPSWAVDNAKPFETLLDDGVSDLYVQFYKKGTDIDPLSVNTTLFELPARAEITLVLHDPSIAVASEARRIATERPFSRGVNLNKFKTDKIE